MQWYLKVLRNYFGFKGRARRKEYWYFFLFNTIIAIVLSIADLVFKTEVTAQGTGMISSIYSLLILIPSIAVGVRRLHDLDKSGWWMLIGIIPLIGAIVLIYFFVQDGQASSNRFGPDPKNNDNNKDGILSV
ncbi:DUF805 domain-containing protein [Photobacterium damselae subsp. damselae]|uniref:DUF805 domain-containing protein n=1 Tax=Photobacterium damselae TaxID=38293 RepID=UPI001F243F15|nr:DUF805 domain-containing protein [Photobacterium damselae]UKA26391.1 DUF805 domain-containing protein [Photobacterium damselae subsp. damselae]